MIAVSRPGRERRSMRPLTKLIWSVACGMVCAVALTVTAAPMARASEAGTLLIASGHPSYPPFMWRQGDRIVGVGPSALELALAELGIAVSVEYRGAWDEVQAQAAAGEIDMIASLYEAEERKAYLEYTVPISEDPVAVLVVEGRAFTYAAWEDLKGKKGVSTNGESFGTVFDDYIDRELDVARYATVRECLQALREGRVDYMLYGLYAGTMEAERLGYGEVVHLTPYVTVENWHMAIAKSSPFAARQGEINAALQALVDDGTIERLIEVSMEAYNDSL